MRSHNDSHLSLNNNTLSFKTPALKTTLSCISSFDVYVYNGSSGKESACNAGEEMQFRSLGWEDHLEKEMAIHSSILAWEIPGTEGSDGLQSTEFQRVGHD